MKPTPSGRLIRTSEGTDLELIRTFRAPIDDVWASITEPQRTARWFGAWRGEGRPGGTIWYSMAFEEGDAESQMTIVACDAPRHLAVSAVDDHGSWHLEAHLTEQDGTTTLRFVQHLDERTEVGNVGPGWEYYLDNLVASRAEKTLPDFSDYYPSQQEYYLGLKAEQRTA